MEKCHFPPNPMQPCYNHPYLNKYIYIIYICMCVYTYMCVYTLPWMIHLYRSNLTTAHLLVLESTTPQPSVYRLLFYPLYVLCVVHIRKQTSLSTKHHAFTIQISHDDVNIWKHFPRYWPFVRGLHRSPVNSPHKDQWRGALMFSLICVWINGWVNIREDGDLRCHRAHYDVTVIISKKRMLVYSSPSCSSGCCHTRLGTPRVHSLDAGLYSLKWGMKYSGDKPGTKIAYLLLFYISITPLAACNIGGV